MTFAGFDFHPLPRKRHLRGRDGLGKKLAAHRKDLGHRLPEKDTKETQPFPGGNGQPPEAQTLAGPGQKPHRFIQALDPLAKIAGEGRLEERADQRSALQRGRAKDERDHQHSPLQGAGAKMSLPAGIDHGREFGPGALTIEGLQLRCVRQGQLGDMESEAFAQLADQPRERCGRERKVPLFRCETVLPFDHCGGDQVSLPGQDQIVRRCGEPGQVTGKDLGCEILRPQDRS